jgi:hypothetical protein
MIEDEFQQFEKAIASFERVDEELWGVSRYCLDTSAYSRFQPGATE